MKAYYEDSAVTIYHASCLDVLPTFADKSVDHVITDPPFRRYVGDNQPGKHGALRDGGVRIRDLGYAPLTSELIDAIAPDVARLVTRWALVFSDVESTQEWREKLNAAGLRYVRTGAWHKLAPAPQFSGDRPAVGFEAVTIMHAHCAMRWNGGGRAGIWSHYIVNSSKGERKYGHPTPKPLSLITELVTLFTDPGELILDPFMGSGTTLRAAKDCGRKAIGIEINERYAEIAAKRMRQEVLCA